MTAKPFSLDFQPGVQRDGTIFDAKRYTDMLWCRFRLNRPRKIGGQQRITDTLLGAPRKIHMFYQGNQVIMHIGTSGGLQQVVTDIYGNLISVSNRTPQSFAAGEDPGWTFDALFNTASQTTTLVAHCNSNISQIASTLQTTPFIGQIDLQTPLVPFANPHLADGSTYTQPSVAGGIFCVQPYVMDFDINGFVGWSAPLLPNTLGIIGGTSTAGQTRVSSQKLVAGIALRGGGYQSPAGLLWSLSELIGFTFAGTAAMGAPTWAFNTLSTSISILAGATVIEYDGLYFWLGIDRAMVFNGTVTELPNTQNQDWFFGNINRAYAGRSFAFKVPRYGEIWWCAPLFGNVNPSHALIYNVRENYWYDTALPAGGWGAGFFAQGFQYPVVGGLQSDANGYKLWLNEIGTDINDGGALSPIQSYFESPYFGGPKNDPPEDGNLSVQSFEPDLQQTGDMTISLVQQANARAPKKTVAGPITIPQVAPVPQSEFANFKKTGRLSLLHIESNVLGGNYICGRNLLHGDSSDRRLTS